MLKKLKNTSGNLAVTAGLALVALAGVMGGITYSVYSARQAGSRGVTGALDQFNNSALTVTSALYTSQLLQPKDSQYQYTPPNDQSYQGMSLGFQSGKSSYFVPTGYYTNRDCSVAVTATNNPHVSLNMVDPNKLSSGQLTSFMQGQLYLFPATPGQSYVQTSNVDIMGQNTPNLTNLLAQTQLTRGNSTITRTTGAVLSTPTACISVLNSAPSSEPLAQLYRNLLGREPTPAELASPCGTPGYAVSDTTSVCTQGAQPCGTLSTEMSLTPGNSLNSCSRWFVLAMQADGNLVVYKEKGGGGTQALWASATNGNPVEAAIMQADGNFVVYNPSGTALWASGTAGNPGAYVVMQDDGNLVVYSSSGTALWASNTAVGPPGPAPGPAPAQASLSLPLDNPNGIPGLAALSGGYLTPSVVEASIRASAEYKTNNTTPVVHATDPEQVISLYRTLGGDLQPTQQDMQTYSADINSHGLSSTAGTIKTYLKGRIPSLYALDGNVLAELQRMYLGRDICDPSTLVSPPDSEFTPLATGHITYQQLETTYLGQVPGNAGASGVEVISLFRTLLAREPTSLRARGL